MRLLALCLLATSACADEPPACWTWTERPPRVCLVAAPGWLVRDGWRAVSEVCAPDAAALRRKAVELRLPVCGE